MNRQKLTLLLLVLLNSGFTVAQEFDHRKFTSAELRVEHSELLVDVKTKKLFDYVTDHSQLQNWTPGGITVTHLDNTNAEKNGGVGCVRTCSITGFGEIKETIVYKDRPSLFAYSMHDNNLFGYSNHLMVIQIEKKKEGAQITWRLYFDHQQAEQAAAKMRQAFSSATKSIHNELTISQ